MSAEVSLKIRRKNNSSKNYAKHCFNHERTLPINSLNLDVDPYRKLCMHNCQKIEKL